MSADVLPAAEAQEDLPAAAVRTWDGPRITTPARTGADVARWSPDLVEAVTRLDRLLAAGALRVPRLPEVQGWLRAGPGSVRGRRALELADGRAESAPESQLRVRLVAAGWRVIHVTAADMHHPGAVIAAVRAALGS